MPRGRKMDLFGTLRSQAAAVIGQIESHIGRLEGELEGLREQAEVWKNAIIGKSASSAGRNTTSRRGRSAGATRPRGSHRVNWDEVLSSVPQRFGIEDVMKHPGAAAKGRAQVYPALNRWEATKRITRVSKGIYEKAVAGGAPRSSAPTAKRGPAKKRAAAHRTSTGRKRGRPVKATPQAKAKAS